VIGYYTGSSGGSDSFEFSSQLLYRPDWKEEYDRRETEKQRKAEEEAATRRNAHEEIAKRQRFDLYQELKKEFEGK
jgi:hypothetical protein